MSRDQSAVLPAKIEVVFRTRRCTGAVSDTSVPNFYIKTYNLSDLTPADPDVPGNLAGAAGATFTIRDSAVALMSVSVADPTNKTALDDLAKTIAQAWFDWTTSPYPGDVIYNGIAVPNPSGLNDTVEWSYRAGDCSTRVVSAPLNAGRDEMQHWDPAWTGCADTSSVTTTKTPYVEVLGPPWKCVSGQLQVTRYRVSIEAGRLVQTFVSSDTIS
jgi:hypothetical protein